MFERFTDGARRSVVTAQEVARAKGASPIDVDHLVLGILIVSEMDPVVGEALAPLDCSIEALANELAEAIPTGSAHAEGHLPFAKAAKDVLAQGLQEAKLAGDQHIGNEHLILATGGTTSTSLLEAHGATYEAIGASRGGEPAGPGFQVRTTKGGGRFRRKKDGA